MRKTAQFFFHTYQPRPINNNDRTERNPIRSVIILVIGRQQVLLPINLNHCSFRRQQIHLGQISLVETMFEGKKFLHFGNSLIFFRISGCCYGYCD